MSAYIYDIALLLIMIVCIGLGYKRGVLRTILNCVCFVIAFAIASVLSSQSVTTYVYDKYLHDKVQQRIDTVVQDVKTKAQNEIRDKANELADEIIEESFGDNEFMKQFAGDIIDDGGKLISESIPKLYNYLDIDLRTLLTNPQISDKIKAITEKYGDVIADELNSRMPLGIKVDKAYVRDMLSDENAVEAIFTELWGIRSENAEYNGIADYLEQIVVRPACIRFLGMIIWAVVFALCSLVLHLIVRAVLVVRKLQPIKACDSILGAVAGAATGAAVIAACCMLIVLAVRWTGGTEYMNEDIFSHTLVFGRIYDLMTELKI